MRVLVVFCHPCEESFNAAICRKVVATLEDNGHDVRLSDLYSEGFDPVMSGEERRNYHSPDKDNVPIAQHLENIKWCQAMVFVYPTWWYGQPAMLKGWLERVWVPFVTFELPNEDHGLQPKMQHISHIGIVTTCGAPWWLHKLIGEPGKKTLLRGIKHLCKRGCKTMFLAHYKMDLSTQVSREVFLEKVGRKISAFVR